MWTKQEFYVDNDIIIVFGKRGEADEENRKAVTDVSALLVLFAQVPYMNQRVSAAAKTTTEEKTTVKTTKKKNGLYKEGNGKFCYLCRLERMLGTRNFRTPYKQLRKVRFD